jgi:NADPH:quinone reductase-like Zn-dependent oxidoreductase
MKAIICDGYGAPDEVLRFADIDEPAIAGDEVLVRVRAASVNPADWHLVRGEPYVARLMFGLRRPNIGVPGCDVAGRVEQVGPDVTTFRLGDEVFGNTFMRGFGAFGELVGVSADLLEPKPDDLPFDQAAAVPLAGLTALQGLRDHGRVEPGHRVLIIGASGGVGTFAVQIAKALGAEVTAVCSTTNMDLVRSLGADDVIDYTREDFTERGPTYDLVFQVAGTRSPSDCRRALTPRGTLVSISGDSSGRWIGAVDRLVKAKALSPFVSQRIATFTVKPTKADLHDLKELIEAGDVTPVIDRTYPLNEVPDALRYLETGHVRGKVVITV